MQNSAPDRSQSVLFPDVLLCISSDAETQDLLLAKRLYGKQLLFHQIRQLQAIGANTFYVAVETVSGSLIALGDELREHGVKIEYLRTPAELASKVLPTSRVLLYSADILADAGMTAELAGKSVNTILIVEENETNQQFERIDLNSRWGGLALIEHKSLAAVSSVPEGWDVASTLLRQSLQDHAAPMLVRQIDVQAGKIAKLKSAADIERNVRLDCQTNGWLEKLLFKPLRPLVTKYGWETTWSRDAFCLAFPILGIFSALLTGFGVSLAGSGMAALAILAAEIRSFVNSTEVKTAGLDLIAYSGWLLLTIVLGLALHQDGNVPFDALFLSAIIAGLWWLAGRLLRISYLSPLIMVLGIGVGVALDSTTVAAKLMITVQVALLVLGSWRLSSRHD